CDSSRPATDDIALRLKSAWPFPCTAAPLPIASRQLVTHFCDAFYETLAVLNNTTRITGILPCFANLGQKQGLSLARSVNFGMVIAVRHRSKFNKRMRGKDGSRYGE